MGAGFRGMHPVGTEHLAGRLLAITGEAASLSAVVTRHGQACPGTTVSTLARLREVEAEADMMAATIMERLAQLGSVAARLTGWDDALGALTWLLEIDDGVRAHDSWQAWAVDRAATPSDAVATAELFAMDREGRRQLLADIAEDPTHPGAVQLAAMLDTSEGAEDLHAWLTGADPAGGVVDISVDEVATDSMMNLALSGLLTPVARHQLTRSATSRDPSVAIAPGDGTPARRFRDVVLQRTAADADASALVVRDRATMADMLATTQGSLAACAVVVAGVDRVEHTRPHAAAEVTASVVAASIEPLPGSDALAVVNADLLARYPASVQQTIDRLFGVEPGYVGRNAVGALPTDGELTPDDLTTAVLVIAQNGPASHYLAGALFDVAALDAPGGVRSRPDHPGRARTAGMVIALHEITATDDASAAANIGNAATLVSGVATLAAAFTPVGWVVVVGSIATATGTGALLAQATKRDASGTSRAVGSVYRDEVAPALARSGATDADEQELEDAFAEGVDDVLDTTVSDEERARARAGMARAGAPVGSRP